jgi:hypothetical protein
MDKKSHWQKIIDDQIKSSLSIHRYCIERNLSQTTFLYWKNKLSFTPPKENSPSFLPVKIKNPEQPFTVKFLSGQMTFLTEPNPTWFAKVLKEMSREEYR